jgi:putative transposase
MAEDKNTSLASEVVEMNAPVETPVTKKKRAPRQSKTVVAPALAIAETVTSPAPTAAAVKAAGPGRGRKAKSVEANVEASVKTKGAVKGTRRKRTAKPIAQAETAPVTALDEMEDLIKLEEENKRLRKLLSEKLRNENADLRKRLGHN